MLNDQIKADTMVDLDLLLGVWSQLKKKYSNHSVYILLSKNPILEGNTIFIVMDNLTQRFAYDRFKAPLLDFLQKKLNNPNIILESRLVENEIEKEVYTPPEKFNAMAVKNPVLFDLKRVLGLVFDDLG